MILRRERRFSLFCVQFYLEGYCGKEQRKNCFLKKRLEMYYEAEEKILQGQSYTIGSRTLTRTSLANVQSKIKELESEISALETRGNSKRRSVRVIPLG